MAQTSALYITVILFTTVGFGDITTKTEAARLLATGQVIIDLIILGGVGARGHRGRDHPRPAAAGTRR
jgi:hypothetical protein